MQIDLWGLSTALKWSQSDNLWNKLWNTLHLLSHKSEPFVEQGKSQRGYWLKKSPTGNGIPEGVEEGGWGGIPGWANIPWKYTSWNIMMHYAFPKVTSLQMFVFFLISTLSLRQFFVSYVEFPGYTSNGFFFHINLIIRHNYYCEHARIHGRYWAANEVIIRAQNIGGGSNRINRSNSSSNQ